jgi:glutamate-1-semialdehyde 2,1-aminomutase
MTITTLSAPAADLLRTYEARTPASRAAMARAARVMPGGNTRTTTFHPPYPPVFARGRGAILTDLDGHDYIDLFHNGLSLVHGHAHPALVDEGRRVLDHGTAWSGASDAQIAFAELLADRIGGDRQVRFANTGSEAGMLAVKLARVETGRPLILKFRYAYHGSYPDLEAGLYGEGEQAGRAILAEFNDMASVEAAFAAHGPRIAAVMIEPVLFTGRVIPPAPDFLPGVERLARVHGALTLLDDCLMFRLSPSGSIGRLGLDPDIVVLGKFIGGGTPVGAILGREPLMRRLDPTRPGAMFHGGSFNGNVLGTTLGRRAVEMLDAPAIARLDATADRIVARLAAHAARIGLDMRATGLGSVAGVSFPFDPARHEDDPSALGASALFHLAALVEGVSMGPGGLLATSTVIDEALADEAGERLCRALDRMAATVEG